MKLSIIIPVYNGQNTIGDLLEDLCGLRNIDHEVIVVDDGSKDKTTEVIEHYKLTNSNIKLIKKVNGGVSSARNKGIDVAVGEYIMFLDADDRIYFDLLEQFYFEVVLNDAEYNFTGYEEMNYKANKNMVIFPVGQGQYNFKEFAEIFFDNLKINLISYPVNKIYRKSLIKKYNLKFDENMSFAEDLIFNLEYLMYVNKVYICHANYYIYRKFINSQSLSSGYNMNFWEARKMVYQKLSVLENRVDNKNKFLNLKNSYARNTIIYTSRQIVSQYESFTVKHNQLKSLLNDEYLQKLAVFDDRLTKSQNILIKQFKKKRINTVYLFWKLFELKNSVQLYSRSKFKKNID